MKKAVIPTPSFDIHTILTWDTGPPRCVRVRVRARNLGTFAHLHQASSGGHQACLPGWGAPELWSRLPACLPAWLPAAAGGAASQDGSEQGRRRRGRLWLAGSAATTSTTAS